MTTSPALAGQDQDRADAVDRLAASAAPLTPEDLRRLVKLVGPATR